MAYYDAIVLGLGGMGSAALAHLAARGQRVLGLEQFSPAHALGSSHGGSRITRQAYFEHPDYVPLLLRSYELVSELEKATGRSLFVQTGGLFVGYEESDVVQGSIYSARTYNLPHEILSAADIRRRWPVIRPREDEMALYEPNAGVLFPEECVLAHLQAAMTAGAEARFGTKVTGWKPTADGGVVVTTAHGEVAADRLVICAGPWFSQVAPELGLPLQPDRNVMHWFEPAGQAGQFDPDRFPIYILQRKGNRVLYGFPGLPGQGVKCAFHHYGNPVTPETIDREVSTAEVAEIAKALGEFMPEAAGRYRKSAACMYTNTPDEHFVVGLHPRQPQVVLAGGFSGHGFKFTSVMGEILAELAATGSTRHPIGFLSPNRFL